MRLTPFLNHEAVKIRWCLPVQGSVLSGDLPLVSLGLDIPLSKYLMLIPFYSEF